MTVPTDPAQPVDEPAQLNPARPLLTLTDAARACSTSRSTLRRRLSAGAFPNATRDEAGSWVIPIGDLLAAGLRLGRPSPLTDQGVDGVSAPSGQGDHRPVDGVLSERVRELEGLLTIERVRRHAAERIAEAHERHLGTALAALRMLEAGPRAGDGDGAARARSWRLLPRRRQDRGQSH